MAAASIAAVEALKDQGFCRWNYTMRSLHQHVKNSNLRSQAKKLSSSPASSAMVNSSNNKVREQAREAGESLRKVMYLSFTTKECLQRIKGKSFINLRKMSSTSRAWMVAASVAAVEAMKDQGFCRWNYTIRSLHQHVRNNMRSASQSKKLSSSSSSSPSSAAAAVSTKIREVQSKKAKQSEESLRTVMYLSCWGPN
ncbi:hypothetical protein EZV62_020508 [Acer yangbiense]|uniref:Wound-responsive family protein n=2 Tax=Acer TaxID=4022 RepID=A0A5C7HFR8_9ROSI|nr:hypothetical protein EZV62_020508 [Acer yangbiense]